MNDSRPQAEVMTSGDRIARGALAILSAAVFITLILGKFYYADSLIKVFRPGICVIALGIGAAIMSLRAPQKVEKALWILFLCLVAAAEISAITYDRKKQDDEALQRFKDTMSGINTTINDFDRTISRVEDVQQGIIKTNDSLIHLASQMDLMVQSLQHLYDRGNGDGVTIGDSIAVTVSRFRDRVFLLSAEILNFIADRKAHQPKDRLALPKYDAETVMLYEQRFQTRVQHARTKLIQYGSTDRDLEVRIRNVNQIHSVADALGRLAQALPKPPEVNR
ncbi:MAG: hypothetical protein ABSD63_11520 [Candidatus Korobacteraceae bacterium]|jgi:hypothetical protein